MKIVHVSISDSGGAGLCAYRICKAQRAEGIDAKMVVLHKKHNDDFIYKVGGLDYFLGSVKRKINSLFGKYDEVNTCRTLAKQHYVVYTIPRSPINLAENKIIIGADVIHLHWIGGFVDYPTFFEAFKNKPIIYTLHDENLFYGIANFEHQCLKDHPLEQKYYTLKLNIISQLKHLGIVCLSNNVKNKYINHEMVQRALFKVIANMVEYDHFVPMNQLEARKKYNFSTDDTIFSFCACDINEPLKQLNILSEALLKINPNYKILAIGNGADKQNYKNVVAIGSLQSMKDLSLAYAAADFHVVSSMKETFGQTILEAMACGKPVITTPTDATNDIITPKNGIRCTDFTLEALEEGIRKALQTEYSSEEIRQDMVNRYAPEKIAKDYLAFYETL